ncbi:hypothetical protein [Hallella colorans]|uniref:hypothetical protein n=1 Tax=Hallella colorans TaxID=1703337 RepID=UPI00248EDC57|nr:hypothetical protein [Hallella colorans]
MKKKYVIPTVKVIYTMMESTLLAGSPGDGKKPGDPGDQHFAKPNYSIEEQLPNNNEEYEDNKW